MDQVEGIEIGRQLRMAQERVVFVTCIRKLVEDDDGCSRKVQVSTRCKARFELKSTMINSGYSAPTANGIGALRELGTGFGNSLIALDHRSRPMNCGNRTEPEEK